MLDKAAVWPITKVMARAMHTHAETLKRRAEASLEAWEQLLLPSKAFHLLVHVQHCLYTSSLMLIRRYSERINEYHDRVWVRRQQLLRYERLKGPFSPPDFPYHRHAERSLAQTLRWFSSDELAKAHCLTPWNLLTEHYDYDVAHSFCATCYGAI